MPLDDIDPPDAAAGVPYATVLRLVRTHCHPDVEATDYPVLVRRACHPDPQMNRFKAELRGLLCGGVHKLPPGALYAAAGYPEDNDEWFLWRLWQDCYGDEPARGRRLPSCSPSSGCWCCGRRWPRPPSTRRAGSCTGPVHGGDWSSSRW